jgi:hypothetical protein
MARNPERMRDVVGIDHQSEGKHDLTIDVTADLSIEGDGSPKPISPGGHSTKLGGSKSHDSR